MIVIDVNTENDDIDDTDMSANYDISLDDQTLLLIMEKVI